ncbi:MAG: isoprenyl transferase [Rhodospirillales bacterium]|jgi:undecaprenyl diphosphate synthase|nr:isoprenyl transferase [Rhodospirillales bacterium]MBT4038681.1 isoprenyl transferase [Rhodospirillales bacterium]MBT4627796.1 isoprenyl transferase [Rhodospirillales bacterium]MBT5350422.1 isoprenyl transferase [Rhodospirillales bacterium]MBT5519240.1 isoprenyl transferase [Rhodospirillales bacterium]
MTTVSLKTSDPAPAPVHVAIIMDGNGRWARARGLPRIEGHRRGADSVRAVVRAATESGVQYLTLFGFSSENWKRPAEEISDLMGLLKYYLRKEIAELHKNNVRFRVIGNRAALGDDIVALIEDAECHTADNTGLTLVLALSYGGRDDIVTAVQAIAARVAAGEISPEDVDEQMISTNLATGEIPAPDLLIRTSGEQRISNFLLWQMAYTELMFLDCHWPEFDEAQFNQALGAFQNRERRFGATSG